MRWSQRVALGPGLDDHHADVVRHEVVQLARDAGALLGHRLVRSQLVLALEQLGPRGDRLGFGDRISGDDTGFDRGVCTIVGKPQLLCTIQVQLSKGTLTVQGLLPERANKTPVAITGGTGAYNGARGTALVTDTSPTQTDVQITLLP